MSMSELLKAVWDFDISICPDCGHSSMKQLGRCYAPSWLSWLLILFWKSLPTGGFESMSCNVLHHKNQRVFSWFLIIFDDFGHLGTIQSPYKNWLKYRDWVQYERITFRAVPIYCRTALFVNSESDTFLMNYIICLRNYNPQRSSIFLSFREITRFSTTAPNTTQRQTIVHHSGTFWCIWTRKNIVAVRNNAPIISIKDNVFFWSSWSFFLDLTFSDFHIP